MDKLRPRYRGRPQCGPKSGYSDGSCELYDPKARPRSGAINRRPALCHPLAIQVPLRAATPAAGTPQSRALNAGSRRPACQHILAVVTSFTAAWRSPSGCCTCPGYNAPSVCDHTNESQAPRSRRFAHGPEHRAKKSSSSRNRGPTAATCDNRPGMKIPNETDNWPRFERLKSTGSEGEGLSGPRLLGAPSPMINILSDDCNVDRVATGGGRPLLPDAEEEAARVPIHVSQSTEATRRRQYGKNRLFKFRPLSWDQQGARRNPCDPPSASRPRTTRQHATNL